MHTHPPDVKAAACTYYGADLPPPTATLNLSPPAPPQPRAPHNSPRRARPPRVRPAVGILRVPRPPRPHTRPQPGTGRQTQTRPRPAEVVGVDNVQGVAAEVGAESVQGVAAKVGVEHVKGVAAKVGVENVQGVTAKVGVDNVQGVAAKVGVENVQGVAAKVGAPGWGNQLRLTGKVGMVSPRLHDSIVTTQHSNYTSQPHCRDAISRPSILEGEAASACIKDMAWTNKHLHFLAANVRRCR
eukprot:363883-Chlamydomonas_euryale.AAC.8